MASSRFWTSGWPNSPGVKTLRLDTCADGPRSGHDIREPFVGTVGYMSPEQARRSRRGFPVRPVLIRARSSMRWRPAFGRSGKRLAAETMTAILLRRPLSRSSTVAPSAPPPYRWIVERCLAKEPAVPVFVHAPDLAHELATLRDHLSEITRHRTGGRRASRTLARAGANKTLQHL